MMLSNTLKTIKILLILYVNQYNYNSLEVASNTRHIYLTNALEKGNAGFRSIFKCTMIFQKKRGHNFAKIERRVMKLGMLNI
jgi:hypothetical protein